MPALKKILNTVLTTELKDCVTDLETLPNGHVCGHVVSSEFKRKSYAQRRNRIKKALELHLSKNQMLKVSTLLTYTPEEWSVVSDAAIKSKTSRT